MDGILPSAILLLRLLTSDAIAAAPKYDLAHVDGIESFGGSIAAQKLLANNGFVVAAPDFAQIFEPYIKSPLPVFITPDSAWHTYHFLLEQAVKELEGVQADRLRNFSRALHAAAEDQSAKGQPEFRELARYVAVALAFQDPDFAAQLSREDRQIVEALVSGHAPVTVGIGFPLNPVLFRPESFYTQSEALKAYFRARQWYALVDFRLSADHELDLVILLSWLIDSRPELHDAWTQLTRPLDTMVALPEDLTISNVAPELRAIKNSGGDLSTVRGQLPAIKKRLRSNVQRPRINDQLLQPVEYAQFADVTAGFRILPARQLPCAILFQNSVDPKIPRRLVPSGLDFFAGAAALRSPAATRAEETQFGKAVLKAVIQADPGPLSSTLYGQSLTLLTTLQKPLPPTTAAPMRSEAWSDLQLWAQLGAWAELRHTWALHAKPGEMYLGMTDTPPGVVSPYPEFFAGLAKLARDTAQIVQTNLVTETFEPRRIAAEILRIQQESRQARHEGSYDSVGDSIRRYWNFVAACLENSLTNNMTRGGEISTNMLKTAATSGPANDSDRELLQFYFQFTRNAVSTSLTNFAVICDRLAPLASKTRTGTFPTSEEAAWIIDYGEKLAHFHEYSGNSYLEPRDDFSMVSRIFGIPVAESVLYAGVARPQALYVVLRYKNRDQLYRGAVLGYREFQRNETENFDDKAWQEVVARGETPAAPPFTRSFLDATAPGAAETNRIKELSFAHGDLAKPPRSIPIKFKLQQSVLSPAPKQMLNSNEEGWMMSTDDERHVIFIEQLPGKRRLMRDGVPGTEYDSVKFPFPSNDSKHVAYIAKTRGAEFIVLEQQEGKHHMRVIALSQNELPFEFSPNGARLAYAASPDGRKEFVVIDGTEGPEFDSIVPESFSFSSNSLHFAYAARRNGKVSFLKDHKVIAEGDASWSNGGPIGLYLSPDGERVACMVRRGTNWFTIVDGKEVGPFTAISNLGKHAFSSDGKHFAFHAQREGQFVTVLDGQLMEDYSIEGVIFSPAGGHWAIHRSDYEKGLHTVVVDGKPGKMYRGSILGLTFSPDGKRLGYFTHGRADEMISVLHGEEDFEGVEPALFTGIRFSPDSKHFSISGKRGQKAVVIVDGKRYPSADSSQLSGSEVTFSPDSRRWAYEAFHGGRCYWVVSGVEYGPYGRAPDRDSDEPQLSFEETEIYFSPDGEHFAFRANRDGRRLLVVDGVEQEIRDEWFPHSVIVFDSANEFHFLTLTSQKIFLNKVTVNRL